MKRLIVAAGLTALLAGSAYAQASQGNSYDMQDPREKDPLVMYEKERARDRERADQDYQKTLKRTRQDVKAQPMDPWANMRGSDNGSTVKR
jgi:hypothetical protein